MSGGAGAWRIEAWAWRIDETRSRAVCAVVSGSRALAEAGLVVTTASMRALDRGRAYAARVDLRGITFPAAAHHRLPSLRTHICPVSP